ncbi:hypothetical protein SAMN05444008_1085 [Cnuella takakiae]|uniref:Uncharacterized protein n=1 Tax=Cnuella takakiae TaxID=1302690 RepID=A0A1M5BMI7_9BACT|nr:hypothetical protein [Cnuella takakiae]SHF43721.1 hypothetical protein SAMN05444008_1085 [Cnuella takakiae]
MKQQDTVRTFQVIENKDDFNWGATITVMVLILTFIGAIFYVLVSSLKDLAS